MKTKKDQLHGEPLIAAIDQHLPQTQCTQCDYPRCREYAEAIAKGEAKINQCPPGGETTILALANLLDTPVLPLNPENGVTETKQVAFIDEEACIGCKLCIKACPVDCIIGSGKLMHTVIADQCTGCKLCLPVCPTDCIHLGSPPSIANQPASIWPDYSQAQVDTARHNTEQKLVRVERRELERKQRHQIRERQRMQQEIMAAVKRSTQRKPIASPSTPDTES